jgi:hypothetical protein
VWLRKGIGSSKRDQKLPGYITQDWEMRYTVCIPVPTTSLILSKLKKIQSCFTAVLPVILEHSNSPLIYTSSPKLFCRIFSRIRRCSSIVIIPKAILPDILEDSKMFRSVVFLIIFAEVFLIIQICNDQRDSLLLSNCSKLLSP